MTALRATASSTAARKRRWRRTVGSGRGKHVSVQGRVLDQQEYLRKRGTNGSDPPQLPTMLQSPKAIRRRPPPSASPFAVRLPTESSPVASICAANPRAISLESCRPFDRIAKLERRAEDTTKAVRARPCVAIKHRPSKLRRPSLLPRPHAVSCAKRGAKSGAKPSASTLLATPLATRCTTRCTTPDQPIRASCTTPPGAPTKMPRGSLASPRAAAARAGAAAVAA